MKSIINKIKKAFEPLFDPADKETPENHANEVVRQAAEHLPQSIKDMSPADLQKTINKLHTPNKWAITRACAQPGQLQKKNFVGGNVYPPNYTSEQKRIKIQRQIEKGIIKCNEAEIEERFRLREERIAKQLKKQGEVK